MLSEIRFTFLFSMKFDIVLEILKTQECCKFRQFIPLNVKMFYAKRVYHYSA